MQRSGSHTIRHLSPLSHYLYLPPLSLFATTITVFHCTLSWYSTTHYCYLLSLLWCSDVHYCYPSQGQQSGSNHSNLGWTKNFTIYGQSAFFEPLAGPIKVRSKFSDGQTNFAALPAPPLSQCSTIHHCYLLRLS